MTEKLSHGSACISEVTVHGKSYKLNYLRWYNAYILVITDLQYYSMLSFIAANAINFSCLDYCSLLIDLYWGLYRHLIQMFITNKVLPQVIPMVTIMMHSLDRTENDHGVIGWKAKLKESINQRLGRIEFEEQYSVATLLDGTHHYNYVSIYLGTNKHFSEIKKLLIEQKPNWWLWLKCRWAQLMRNMLWLQLPFKPQTKMRSPQVQWLSRYQRRSD